MCKKGFCLDFHSFTGSASVLLVGILLVFGEVKHNHLVHFKTFMLLGVSTCKSVCVYLDGKKSLQRTLGAMEVSD